MNAIKKFVYVLLASVILVALMQPSVAQAATFKDIKQGQPFYDEVVALFEVGIVTGFPGDEFRPNEKVNRAQAAVMFQRTFDLPIPVNAQNFKDVKKGAYYANAALATKQAQIFKGNADGSFGPADELTREQMASVLVRAFDLEEIPGKTVQIADEASIHPAHKNDVKILFQHGVTKGIGNNFYDPKGTVSRAHFSAFVYRAAEDQGIIEEKLNNKKDDEKKEELPLPGAPASTDKPSVISSVLSAGNKDFEGTVTSNNNGITVNYDLVGQDLTKLDAANIEVDQKSTLIMEVRLNVGGTNVTLNEKRTQPLDAGPNNLDIARTIANYASEFEDVMDSVRRVTASGTLTDNEGNTTKVTLVFQLK